jgi:menaquinone-dependent protoporphyrinogen oxidase
VFFATSEGQTRRIAERFASVLRKNGLDSASYDVCDLERAAIDWTRVEGVILGASLHAGKHQRAAHAFASSQAARLNARPSMFFSVSLAAASQNQEEVRKAQELADAFPAAHGWRPQRIVSLAGRLAYTEYNFFIRFMMKRIAAKEGGPTDTSRDYELTNWARVEEVALEFARTVRTRAAA